MLTIPLLIVYIIHLFYLRNCMPTGLYYIRKKTLALIVENNKEKGYSFVSIALSREIAQIYSPAQLTIQYENRKHVFVCAHADVYIYISVSIDG